MNPSLWLLALLVVGFPATGSAQPSLNICLDITKKDFRMFNFNTQTLTNMCHCVNAKNRGAWPSESDWLKRGKNQHAAMAYDCGKEKITAYHAEILEQSLIPELKKRGFTPDEIRSVSVCAAPSAFSLARNMFVDDTRQARAEDENAVILKARECQMTVKK